MLKNPPGCFSADPFVFSRQGQDFCFVEELNYRSGKGIIVCYSIDDGSFQKLGTALEEQFHLSFPFIFQYDGEIYMCPETCHRRDVRVYKCVDFPLHWVFEKTLIDEIAAVDTIIFEKDAKWWLMTCVNPVGSGTEYSELRVYFAESPLSDRWMPHPGNPVLIDQVGARNGGFFKEDNRFYRVSQLQGFDTYGAGVRINEITTLNEGAYAEQSVKEISPLDMGVVGMHHLSKDGRTIAYDVSFYH
jgi:hypothetical protein